ncbi:MAG: DMT family transporter [Gammaproteobacteria bacterium]
MRPPNAVRTMIAPLWNSAYALLSFTALFWAGNAIVARGARDLVPPVALTFWRWSFALLLLLPFAWRHLKADWPLLIQSWRMLLLLGVLGIGAFNTLLYSGLQTTTALNAMLLQAAQPALILVVGALLLQDRVSVRQIVGVVVSLTGVLVILARGDLHLLLGIHINTGDAIIGVAVLIWSIYSVYLRRRPKVHPLSFMAATLIVGVVFILPLYVWEVYSGRLIVPQTASWLAIAYVSVFPSLVAYLFFNRGVELVGAAATGQFMNVMPVIGAVLSVLFLGEAFRLFHLTGMLLVGVGILIAGPNLKAPAPAGTPR